MANKILHECMKKGFLLDREMLDIISNLNENGVNEIIFAISKIGIKERVVTKKVFTDNFDKIQKHLLNLYKDDILMNFFSTLGFAKKDDFSKKTDINMDDGVISGKIKLVSVPAFPQRKITVKDFINHFRNRYERLQSILEKQGFDDLSSIRRIGQGNGNYTIIAAVINKKTTKNHNIMIEVEDLTGTISVLVNRNNKELYKIASNLLLDDIVAFSVSGNNDLLFVGDIIFPEAYLDEKKYGKEDNFIAFISDLHVGSRMFLESNFLKFIKWINGSEGSDSQRIMAKKIRYLFIAGDIIDGIDNFPNQESSLNIKTTVEQYEKVCKMIKLIRSDIQIIMCPGGHDAVWMGEPQPVISEVWAKNLYKIPNLLLVPNPSIVSVNSGFKILMYHGSSINNIIDNISDIRINIGHNSPTTVLKEMVRRRHLAISHGSVDYIPCEKDSLLIDPIPDIIFTGNQHRSEVSTFNNIMLISGSCFKSIDIEDEKNGIKPEPCRVPLFNMKTREVKMLDFSGEEDIKIENNDGLNLSESGKDNEKIKVGIDIDDTLISTCVSIIDFYNKKNGTNFKVEDNLSDKRFHEFLGISKSELINLYKEHDSESDCELMVPNEGANELLSKLKEKYELLIVTARPEKIKEETMRMLEKFFPENGIDVHFLNFDNDKKVSKGEFCKNNNIKLMIDDDKDNALSCAENGINVILLNRPWNIGVEHDKIKRVNGLVEILEIIDSMINDISVEGIEKNG